MERLESLLKSQRDIAKKQPISSTLLITSSGFESFDQAFNRFKFKTTVKMTIAGV